MQYLDSLRQLIESTGHGTAILVGLLIITSAMLFFSAREFNYRYLKIHLVRKELRALRLEIEELKALITKQATTESPLSAEKPQDAIEPEATSTPDEPNPPKSSATPQFPLNS